MHPGGGGERDVRTRAGAHRRDSGRVGIFSRRPHRLLARGKSEASWRGSHGGRRGEQRLGGGGGADGAGRLRAFWQRFRGGDDGLCGAIGWVAGERAVCLVGAGACPARRKIHHAQRTDRRTRAGARGDAGTRGRARAGGTGRLSARMARGNRRLNRAAAFLESALTARSAARSSSAAWLRPRA